MRRMRRLALSALALAALVAAPSAAEAQVSFGPVVAFHGDADFGAGALVKMPLPVLYENMGLMGDFIWFFPEGFDYWEINGNLTYDFAVANSSIVPFALAGLNVAHASVEFEGVSASDTELGLNLGGGVTFGGSRLRPTVGGRIQLGGGESFVLFGAILFGG